MKKIRVIVTVFAIMVLFGLLFLPAKMQADKKKDSPHEAQTEEQKKKGRSGRGDRRPFYTAPPVVPHEITSRGSRECLTCHSQVREIGGEITIKTPHVQFTNCLQCHVQGKQEDLPVLKTLWTGLKEPKNSSKLHEFVPMTIPHRIFLRENCLSCHGPKNKNKKMRASHPERTNCMQCHVPNADNEFKVNIEG